MTQQRRPRAGRSLVTGKTVRQESQHSWRFFVARARKRLSARIRARIIYILLSVLAIFGQMAPGIQSMTQKLPILGDLAPVAVNAAVGINEQLNFQARLMTAGGALVPDGNYNMQFQIYQDGDGNPSTADETAKWIETRRVSDSSYVRVLNGYVSVKLGSVTPFGSSVDWDQSVIWLSINIGNTTNTSNCLTEALFNSNCGGDGEMNPMFRLTSVPQALNSQQLGGRDKDDFVQLNPGSTQSVGSTTPAVDITQTSTGQILKVDASNSSANGVQIDVQSNSSSQYALNVTSNNGGTQGLYVRADGNVGIGEASPQAVLHVDGTIRFEDFTTCGALTTDADGDLVCSAGGGGSGDSISVNGSAATDANFLNTTATSSVAGVTWALDTGATPDGISLTIGAASATEAGIVTATGSQTFAGNKTFSGNLTVQGDLVSTGTTWSARAASDANTWQSVAYGNGLFVAVASSGTGTRVMSSPDGVNWTTRTSASDHTWTGITYGNGLFVAVGGDGISGRIMTSPNGVTWTAVSSSASTNRQWRNVAYGDGKFVAISDSSANTAVTASSSDGFNWTIGQTGLEQVLWRGITYGDGKFVAVTATGTNRVMTSTDGTNWTTVSVAASAWQSVTYANGLFVAVASTGTDQVMTSPNGSTWTVRTASEANGWVSVTYGNGLFVAVSNTGTNRVMISTDGINWTARAAAEANAWRSVTYGNGVFTAVSSDGTNRVMTSGKLDQTPFSANNKLNGGLTVTGATIFQSGTDSTTALQVQNASGNSLLTVDSTNNEIELGKAGASGINGKLLFYNATNSNTVSLLSGVTSASYTLTLPTTSPGLNECLKAGASTATDLVFGSCGSAGGDSISVNGSAATDANFLNTTATTSVAGVTWSLNTASTPDDITLQVGAASATVAGIVTATGTQTFAGTKTFNDSVGIGTTAPISKLDVISSTTPLLTLGSSNTGVWSKMGGDDTGSGALGWADATFEYVKSSATLNGKLYVGLGASSGDADVWEYSGSTWTKVGGDAVNSSWPTSPYGTVYSMTTYKGMLYAGLSWGGGDAEVWAYNGSTWSQVGGDGLDGSWNTSAQIVSTLVSHNGLLYAGTAASGYDQDDVYSYDGSSWTKVGGDSVNSSWAGTSTSGVQAMASYNGKLYASIGDAAFDGQARVYEFNGSTWTQTTQSWGSTPKLVTSLTVFNNRLYAGTGTDAGDGDVWVLSGSAWTQMGGDTLNSSWANSSINSVLSMTTFNGLLYAGLGSGSGDSDVWSYNGSTWVQVGGDAVNSSWAASTYDTAETLIPYNGKLYAGIGVTAGEAELWELDSSGSTTIAKNGTGISVGNQLFLGNNNQLTVGSIQSAVDLEVSGSLRVSGAGLVVKNGNVTTAGNVGIGDSTPDAKLDVEELSTSTTAATLQGYTLTVTDTGIVTTGTDTTYGQRISLTRTGATGGTIDSYGLDIQATSDNAGAGTSTLTGLNVNVSGADTNYAAILQGGNVGIGEAAPQAVLHVDGTIRFEDFTTCGALSTDADGDLVCSASAGGDSISVNGSAATDANFLNTTATTSVAGVTWTIDTGATPDGISLTIGAASATEAGIVTATGSQTFAGSKTFTGNVTVSNGSTLSTAPLNPIHVGALADDGTNALDGAYAVDVVGKYAYVVSDVEDALEIIDISNPASPTHIGKIVDDATTLLNAPRSVEVVGKYAYVTSFGDSGLEIIDISNPASPTHVGAIGDAGATELSGAYDVAVVGKYAYVASLSDDGVEIIDISNPANPTHVGAITDDVTTELDGAMSIEVVGRYAYVSSNADDGVEVLDISNPASPTHVGAITDDGTTELDGAAGLVVIGRYAYVTAVLDDGVEVLDISNPASPTHVGAITDDGTTLLDSVISLAVSGKYAYVVSTVDDSVEVLDISNPASPTHVGSIADNGTTELDGAFDIKVVGRYLYVTGEDDDGFEILDIGGIETQAANIGDLNAGSANIDGEAFIGSLVVQSGLNVGQGGIKTDGDITVGEGKTLSTSPLNPIHVGSIVDDATSELIDAEDLVVVGNYAYVVGETNDSLQILDVSNPASPTYVSEFLDAGARELNNPKGIAVVGKYAYITGNIDDGVEIVDISNPASPTHVGAITDTATTELDGASDIVVVGRYAYVTADTDDGVEILDISNPANPTHVGSITDDGTTMLDQAKGIEVVGKYAYVTAATDDGVEILDISNPASPTHVGAITDDVTMALNGAYSIAVSGKYAYVAGASDHGVEILDISNPASPSHVGVITDGGSAALATPSRIVVQGKYAYVTTVGDDGVEILNISNPASPTHVGAITDDGTTALNGARSIQVVGRYAYVASETDNGVEILDIGGADLHSVTAGAVIAESTNVTGELTAGQLNVSDGVNVGRGGVNIDGGGLGVVGATTIKNSAIDDASLGSELIVSQDFTNATYWNNSTGWTETTTTATHTTGNTTSLTATSSNITVASGVTYQVAFQVSGNTTTSNVLNVAIGGATSQIVSEDGTHTLLFTTTGTGALTFTPSTNFNGTISNISVKALTATSSVLSVTNTSNTTTLEVRTSSSTNNLFIGLNAGKSNTSGGLNNTALGSQALQNNTTGDNNIAIGTGSMQLNTIGTNSVAIGRQALYTNTSGSDNVAIGDLAMTLNRSGTGNVALGSAALTANTTGHSNSAVGHSALGANTIGGFNSALGEFALLGNTTGSYNSAVGFQAGYNNATGTNNTYLGYNAGYRDPTITNFVSGVALTNATAIGYGAQIQASNSIVLGGQVANQVNVGIGTTSPTNVLSVSPYQYFDNSRTASQSGNTVTGSASTAFTSSMVGSEIVWADGSKATITGYTSATVVSATPSQTVSSQKFRVHYAGLQVTSTGNVGIGTTTPGTNKLSVAADGGASALTIGSDGTSTFGRSINTSGGGNPVHVAAVPDTVGTALAGATDVDIEGKYAYVLSVTEDLEILDISNPANPVHAGSKLDDGTTLMDTPDSIDVVGNYAYITSQTEDALEILDVSNPASPTHVGSIADGGSTLLNDPDDIVVIGRYAYIVSDAEDALEIIDVSNPASPTHVGSLVDNGTTLLDGAQGLAVVGKYAYVATGHTSSAEDGLEIIDISNPASPTHVGSLADNGTTALLQAWEVVVEGRYAYVTSGEEDGVEIIDISNPASPTHVGVITDTATTELDGAYKIVKSGNYLYVAASNDDGIEVIDVTIPASPTHVGAITDNGTTELDGPLGLDLIGRYLYVGGWADNGVEVLDIGGGTIHALVAGAFLANEANVTSLSVSNGLMSQDGLSITDVIAQNGSSLEMTTTNTGSGVTARGISINLDDGTSNANTNIGLYIDPSTSNGSDTEIAAILAGKVRIGGTSNPSATLDVTGTFAVSGTSAFSDDVTLAAGKFLKITESGGADIIGLGVGAGSASYNLNLPTTSPGTSLCLKSGASTATNLEWGSCGGGGGTKTVTLIPEYAGATLTADGSSNNGTMTSEFCSSASRKNLNATFCNGTEEHNYYQWKANTGSTQDYDIYIRYQIPSDYVRNGSSQITLTPYLYGWRDTSSDSVTLTMYNAANGQCGNATTITSSDDTWQETVLGGTLTSDADCNAIVANDVVIFKISVVSSGTSAEALAGELRMTYTAQ